MIELQISESGSKWWWVDSTLHRDNGPSIIKTSGYQAWYNYDKWHRTDGPARILDNGSVEYWINGNQVSEYELMFMNERCV